LDCVALEFLDSSTLGVLVGAVKRVRVCEGAEDTLNAGSSKRPRHWAVEVKRKATIDAVEQLSRYVELLNRDPLIRPVGGILAAQSIAPQARVLAEDRGLRCVVLDCDLLRGIDNVEDRLF
jgi:RecB family endonuclease NucS